MHATTVSLVAGLKEVLKLEASVDYTFLKLLEIAVEKSGYSSASESATCYLSQDIKCTTKVQVGLDYNVCQCCDLNVSLFPSW